MPAEPPAAFVVHRLPGRLRLRIEGKRGDRAWFDDAATTLAMLAGVEEVAASARTSSIKLRHSRPAEDVLAAAAGRGLFTLVDADGGEGSAAERLRAAAGGFTASEGLAAVLTVAALRQVLRGQILPPAVTLLAYAATVLATRDRQSTSSDDAPVDSQPGSGSPPPT
ncbi:MAG: hypothetical protein GVY33_02005 [Alphaproteobacteria bacterium]|jgi:hypothetical protein|nr:hypothetical protein [Alphaproteobacteria bacterium]